MSRNCFVILQTYVGRAGEQYGVRVFEQCALPETRLDLVRSKIPFFRSSEYVAN